MYILSQVKQTLTFDHSTCKKDNYPFYLLIVTIIHSCPPSRRLFNSDIHLQERLSSILRADYHESFLFPLSDGLSIQRYTFSPVQIPFDNNICKKDYFIILRADYHESFLFPFQAAFHLQIQVTLQILSTDKGNKLRHCLDKKYTLGL